MYAASHKRLPAQQITSKGCSRGFILCVLYRALEYVRQRHTSGLTVQFPFCHDEIRKWLEAAQMDCSICEDSFQEGLGGTAYDVRDPSTYWTQPQQFCTWWKNNVERKNKFLILQRDATYSENLDEKLMARAAYCRNAIAISLSMKNYFYRYLPKERDAKIVQYIVPYPMPVHLTAPHTLKVKAEEAHPFQITPTKEIEKAFFKKEEDNCMYGGYKAEDMAVSIVTAPPSPPTAPTHFAQISSGSDSKKRKQRQTQSLQDSDGPYYPHDPRKQAHTTGDGHRTGAFFQTRGRGSGRQRSSLYGDDDASCSSDSGSDDEGASFNHRSRRADCLKIGMQEEEDDRDDLPWLGAESQGIQTLSNYNPSLSNLNPSFQPIDTRYMHPTHTNGAHPHGSHPHSISHKKSTDYIQGKMRTSLSVPLLSSLTAGRDIFHETRRLTVFTPQWSPPPPRTASPSFSSQFSVDRSFDDDLLAMLTKGLSSSREKMRSKDGGMDLEECLFLSMSITPTSSFGSYPCSPLHASGRQMPHTHYSPCPSLRGMESTDVDQFTIFSPSRMTDLLTQDLHPPGKPVTSMPSPFSFSYSYGSCNKLSSLDDELRGNRKVRFSEIDEVRMIKNTPVPSRRGSLEPQSFENPIGINGIGGVDRPQPNPYMTAESTFCPSNSTGSGGGGERQQYILGCSSSCSSLDTMDCNDLISIISDINEGSDIRDKERERPMGVGINGATCMTDTVAMALMQIEARMGGGGDGCTSHCVDTAFTSGVPKSIRRISFDE